MSETTERTLVVETRDLDTDERTVTTLDVEMPADESGRRSQLSQVVAQLHPSARIRSFGGAAASFLDSEQLVVAHYGESRAKTRETSAEPVQQVEQQPLFTV